MTVVATPILISLLAVFLLFIAFRNSLRIKQLFKCFIDGLRRVFGLGLVDLISAPQTVILSQISNSTEKGGLATGQTSLRSLVEQIAIPVKLNPFLFNGHIQTISVALGWAGSECHIHYKRKYWQSDSEFYPGQFAIDFVIHPPAKLSPRDRTLPPRTNYFEENEWSKYV